MLLLFNHPLDISILLIFEVLLYPAMNPLYVVDEPVNMNSGLSSLIFFILHDDEIYPNKPAPEYDPSTVR